MIKINGNTGIELMDNSVLATAGDIAFGTEPLRTKPGMIWADTVSGVSKRRDSTDSYWIPVIGEERFMAAGTYTFVAKSTTIVVDASGGGGGGGASTLNNTSTTGYPGAAGGAGGSQGANVKDYTISGLTIGQSYEITVGAGGAKGLAINIAAGNSGVVGNRGSDGGPTLIDTLLRLEGGYGGAAVSSFGASTGFNAAPVIGVLGPQGMSQGGHGSAPGAQYGIAAANKTPSNGGNGGGPYGGLGGDRGPAAAGGGGDGRDGQYGCGGGGGGGGRGNGTIVAQGGHGGNGGDGFVIIRWFNGGI